MRFFRRGEASTLDLFVVGLGNPGREYERTRHNAGWLVLDELARRLDASWRGKFSGRLTEALLVVHDDVDLQPGRLQARAGGGLAGHNGLRSLAQALGSQDFLRLRIGVGRPGRGDRRSVADYVLAPFDPDEDLEGTVARSADAVETIAAAGLEAAQQRFN